MKRSALVLALALGACDPGLTRPSPVILISIDGFWTEYFDYGVTPTLARLAREGVRADAMRPTFPTKTFPNHYSIVTGLYAEDHGIVANNMWDPATGDRYSLGNRDAVTDARWYGGEPIWVTAERQGQRTAAMFWPGSEAPIGGMWPTHWVPFDDDSPNPARVDSVLAWLDLPEPERPAFLTLYYSDVDHAGHDTGIDTPELRAALAHVDSMIGLLVVGLEARGTLDDVNIIVVSDHGMTPTSPERVLFLDDYVDLDEAFVSDSDPVAALWPRDSSRIDAMAAALRAGSERWTVWRKPEIPERFHYRDHVRIAPIIVLADEGWSIASRRTFRPGRYTGATHGYDNALASMQALFVARGPAFKRGYVSPAFQNIHVYELMTHILGLEPAANRGSVDSVRMMLRRP
jgi:predicted AlkP superfamily pyrophosphatase or phosphodiesterase